MLTAIPLLTHGCRNQRRAADSRRVTAQVSTLATKVLVNTVK
jgi:hypothetical protein